MPPHYCRLPGAYNVSHGQGQVKSIRAHHALIYLFTCMPARHYMLEAGTGCLLSVVSLAGDDLHTPPDHKARKHQVVGRDQFQQGL